MTRIVRKTSGEMLKQPSITAGLASFGVRAPIAEQARGTVREVRMSLPELVDSVAGITAERHWDNEFTRQVLDHPKFRILGIMSGGNFKVMTAISNDQTALDMAIAERSRGLREGQELVLLRNTSDFRTALRLSLVAALTNFMYRLEDGETGVEKLTRSLQLWSDVIRTAPNNKGREKLLDAIYGKFCALRLHASEDQLRTFNEIFASDRYDNGNIFFDCYQMVRRETDRRSRQPETLELGTSDLDTAREKQYGMRRLVPAAITLIVSTALALLLAVQMLVTYRSQNIPIKVPIPTYATRQYAGVTGNKMEEVLGKPLDQNELEAFAKKNKDYMIVRENLTRVLGARFINLIERAANNLDVDPLMILTIFAAENGAVGSTDNGRSKFYFIERGILRAMSDIRNGFEMEVNNPSLDWMPSRYRQNNMCSCSGPFQFSMGSFKGQKDRVRKALGVDITEDMHVTDPRVSVVRSVAVCAAYIKDAEQNLIPPENKRPKARYKNIKTGSVASMANYYNAGLSSSGTVGYGSPDIYRTGGPKVGVADLIYAALANPNSHVYESAGSSHDTVKHTAVRSKKRKHAKN